MKTRFAIATFALFATARADDPSLNLWDYVPRDAGRAQIEEAARKLEARGYWAVIERSHPAPVEMLGGGTWRLEKGEAFPLLFVSDDVAALGLGSRRIFAPLNSFRTVKLADFPHLAAVNQRLQDESRRFEEQQKLAVPRNWRHQFRDPARDEIDALRRQQNQLAEDIQAQRRRDQALAEQERMRKQADKNEEDRRRNLERRERESERFNRR